MKELGKKNPEYVKLRIECMMAILDQDPDTFNEKIGPFCKAWMKGQEWGMNAFTKGFCVEAHGMYNLAKWAYGGVMKDQIRMPDEKNFCQDLALWQEEHGCKPGKTRHYFPESIDIYNKIRDSKPVCMHLKKEGKQQVLDPMRYLEDYIRENGF